MARRQDILTLLPMVSSVLLLMLFQFFWLQNSYEKAFFDLKRETSMLLRNTVVEFRAANLMRNIELLPSDSLRNFNTRIRPLDSSGVFIKSDTFSAFTKTNTAFQKSKVKEHIQVYISGTDTLTSKTISGIRQRSIHKHSRAQKNFMIRMIGSDTLNMDSLRQKFTNALTGAGIRAPFALEFTKAEIPGDTPIENSMATLVLDTYPDYNYRKNYTDTQPDFREIYSDSLITDVVRINPFYRYTATFGNIRSLLVQKITPQILFSAVLTIIITTAFILMYRNLRAQQKLMVLKNDFISNVTHELKTPVATVSVALEALKNFSALDDPRRTSEYLEIAQRELNRLTLMTDKILKTSVFDDKGIELKTEKTDVNKLVQQVLSSMKLVFEKRKSAVKFTHEGSDFTVEGEPGHLTNVLYNLLDNAIKYSGEGASIEINITDLPERLLLSIRDNGIGIPEEYQKKIFEKFFRVPSGDVHNTRGYGLGLSYVASVIEQHRGEIRVESELGKGSTFIISLPRRL